MLDLTQFLENSGEIYNNLLQNDFSFEVIDEDKIEWSQFNEIHAVLNKAYSSRSKSFFAKTFGHRPPLKRALCRYKGDLVGISAYFEDYIEINKQKILIGGVGLTCSIMPGHGIGNKLRYIVSGGIGAYTGVPFCIGRIHNAENVKNNLSQYVHGFLNIPLIGKKTKSHEWETIAIYRTLSSDTDIQTMYMKYLNKIGFIQIEGEIF